MKAPATPYLQIDSKVLNQNLDRMAKHAKAKGINLRPHVKTHKSIFLGKRQLESGAIGITVATIGEAEVFAKKGFRDIFGKGTVNLLVVLPIALPGVVTGVAFSNTYSNFLTPAGFQIGYFGMIVAHATFCIVMVFNNVFARLRRMNPSLQEASMDLGEGLWGTFRLVTFPQFRTAFAAGALLAFALSFDEVVVTIFTAPPSVDTLPLWILKEMARPNQASVVNVVATVVIVLSLIPVYVSQRLSRTENEK
jgi:putative spermidine/putrescine transport system permease protein